jgi:hypothetical protein
MQVLRMDRELPVYVVADGEITIAAKDWPVALKPVQAAYHPGDTVEIRSLGMDALSRVEIAEVPPGWSIAPTEPAFSVQVAADAVPGDYTIQFRVSTMGQEPVNLPVSVTIAPALVRD